jgi:hypothetical protein
MALVTDLEVKTILETSIDTTPFITTADLVVTENLASSGYSVARLKQIELYLAAHFTCVRERQLKVESVNKSSNTYQGDTGKGLDSSLYGQQVQMLDNLSILAELDKPKAKLVTIRADLTRTNPSKREPSW